MKHKLTILSIAAILTLLIGLIGFPYSRVYAERPASKLSAADWAQIKALLPAPSQQAYLKASNTGANDYFGYSIAVSGDTVVVGAHGEDSNATGVNGDQANDLATDAGAVYVFTRSGGVWSQQAYLKASNAGAGDRFGGSVAISGDSLVVGAAGESSSTTGVNGDETNNLARFSGAVYIFTRSGVIWSQQAYLKASNTGASDRFGWSVDISGDSVVVGADAEDSNVIGVDGDGANNSASNAGAAYIFTRSGAAWSQQAYLKASNTEAFDYFGGSVAISGDSVVVSASAEDSSAIGVDGDGMDNLAPDSGAAYIFIRNGATWSQQAYLKASNTETNDTFGYSVSISGDSVVVGAVHESSSATGVDGDGTDNSSSASGAAYIFTRNGVTWSQQAYLKASNTGVYDSFGYSVAISGDNVVVGAPYDDSNATGVNGDGANDSANNAGAAYVFTRSGVTWSQKAYLKASNTEAFDYFGYSVPISGDNVVVGAHQESSSATGVGGNQADNSSTQAGAVYAYTLADVATPTTTATPTITATTETMTLTETETPSASPTVTAISTATRTPSRTATVTKTATPTITKTRTPVTVTIYTIAAHDGWVLESTETSTLGGTLNSAATTFNLGDDTAKKQYRGILSFNTSAIPDNAIVTGVLLKVKQNAIIGGGNPVSIFGGFMADIKNGFFGTFPALQATDFQAADTATYGPFVVGAVANVYNINLTAGKLNINKFATNSGLTQIRLRFKLDDNNNLVANDLVLYSGNATSAADRPQLVITYSVP